MLNSRLLRHCRLQHGINLQPLLRRQEVYHRCHLLREEHCLRCQVTRHTLLNQASIRFAPNVSPPYKSFLILLTPARLSHLLEAVAITSQFYLLQQLCRQQLHAFRHLGSERLHFVTAQL